MNRCYTESDVIAELRGWNEMSGDNDVVCVLWICVVVGTESYVCDQLPKLPEEPPPIGDCAALLVVSFFSPASGSKFLRPEFHADAESGLRTWLRSQIEACTSHF